MLAVSTALVPELVEFDASEPTSAVVIDILRASTTIVTALAQGATEVWPCLEIQQAEGMRSLEPGILLGGERGGLPISGFDCGNSPAEYSRERVAGRAIAFTTTNGTRALERVRGASSVFVGAFVNATAVARRLEPASRVLLVCAGTGGRVTREDVLFAGWLALQLSKQGATLDDSSVIAKEAWLNAFGVERPSAGPLAMELRQTQGGRNLTRLGLEADIERVASWDAYDLVPELVGSVGSLRCP